jgi:hypothetical protein
VNYGVTSNAQNGSSTGKLVAVVNKAPWLIEAWGTKDTVESVLKVGNEW